jgi:hypothetical protein
MKTNTVEKDCPVMLPIDLRGLVCNACAGAAGMVAKTAEANRRQ